MILNDRILSDYIRQGKIINAEKSGTNPDRIIRNVNPNSVDLTLDRIYYRSPWWVTGDPIFNYPPAEYEADQYKRSWHFVNERHTQNSGIIIEPGHSILAGTREWISMPDDCCGQLFTKSSLGRMFINHMMAGVIDAGFEGRLTLEFKNEGRHRIRLAFGSRVVQLIVTRLIEPAEHPYGSRETSRYQNAKYVETAKVEKN